MRADPNPRPDVKRHPEHRRCKESLEEVNVKGEIAKKGQVTVAGIVTPIFVPLYPSRNILDAFLYSFLGIARDIHDLNRPQLGRTQTHQAGIIPLERRCISLALGSAVSPLMKLSRRISTTFLIPGSQLWPLSFGVPLFVMCSSLEGGAAEC